MLQAEKFRAAQYNTWLLIKLTPKGAVFSFFLPLQAEKFRAKAQRPEQSRSHTQYCRYLFYLGRIKAIQLEYTDARDYLQQAARKVTLLYLVIAYCETWVAVQQIVLTESSMLAVVAATSTESYICSCTARKSRLLP